MNTFDITPIISMLVALIGLMITTILIPWIKRKITAEKYSQIAAWVDVAVLAAEQLYGAGKGDEKLAYVAALLHEKGIEFDPENLKDEIRAMIEAAVRTLGEDEIKAMV